MLTMKRTTLIFAAIGFIAGAALAFGAVRWLGMDDAELAFIVGAIVGTQTGVVFHHRTAGAGNTMGVKCVLGAVLALTAALFGLAVHSLYAPFGFAEVSIPFGVIGTFAFPLVIFNTLWAALAKLPKRPAAAEPKG